MVVGFMGGGLQFEVGSGGLGFEERANAHGKPDDF